MCDVSENINSFRFIRSKSAATGTTPIERASKTDLMRILAVYQHKHSDTNNNNKIEYYYLITAAGGPVNDSKVGTHVGNQVGVGGPL